MKELIQNTPPLRHVFTIGETGLQVVTTKRTKPYTAFNLRFEDLTENKQVITITNHVYLAIAGIWLLGTGSMFTVALENNSGVLFFSLLMLPGLLPLVAYFYFKRTILNVHTRSGQQVKFFYSPNQVKDVDAFLTGLYQQKSAFLKKRYGSINKHLPYQTQFDWLNFLLNEKVISVSEYDLTLERLDQLFGGKTSSQIGFGATSSLQ